jgi:SiaC family regulatory phosphoprotein
MEALILSGTKHTPYVNLNPTTGVLQVNGRSTPEHPSEYFAQLYRWVENYLKKPNENTVVRLSFEYFNTSSSKCLLEMMKRLSALHESGKNISFQWMHEPEDDDMKEAGADFRDLLKAPFEIISK